MVAAPCAPRRRVRQVLFLSSLYFLTPFLSVSFLSLSFSLSFSVSLSPSFSDLFGLPRRPKRAPRRPRAGKLFPDAENVERNASCTFWRRRDLRVREVPGGPRPHLRSRCRSEGSFLRVLGPETGLEPRARAQAGFRVALSPDLRFPGSRALHSPSLLRPAEPCHG